MTCPEFRLLLRKHWRVIVGVLAGGTLGAVYALTIGCNTGGCGITESPWTAGPFGAAIGGMLLKK